ncbi:nuclease-related domain-containing protein [Paenibacillus sp. BR2-3]|uniref:nuclease-related domain-containing protein n=1 Tax=Paenibacillus sp. BR2-3 TaxID=3048494 RepID=UPI003977BD27
MFDKLLKLFKGNQRSGTSSAAKPSPAAKTSAQRPKIEPTRIGELGEHKINIQLDQLPKDCKYLNDNMIPNPKAKSGYSQIDHVVISPYGLFVIETKNYNGEIKGSREDRYWYVNNRFKMFNPLRQNYGHIKALQAILPEAIAVPHVSIVTFTMRCRFSIDPALRKIESNELVVYDVELSEFINRKLIRMKAVTKEKPLGEKQIEEAYATIKAANISDPALRAEHIQSINRK